MKSCVWTGILEATTENHTFAGGKAYEKLTTVVL
jgi:hypothetical protein